MPALHSITLLLMSRSHGPVGPHNQRLANNFHSCACKQTLYWGLAVHSIFYIFCTLACVEILRKVTCGMQTDESSANTYIIDYMKASLTWCSFASRSWRKSGWAAATAAVTSARGNAEVWLSATWHSHWLTRRAASCSIAYARCPASSPFKNPINA